MLMAERTGRGPRRSLCSCHCVYAFSVLTQSVDLLGITPKREDTGLVLSNSTSYPNLPKFLSPAKDLWQQSEEPLKRLLPKVDRPLSKELFNLCAWKVLLWVLYI